MYCLYRKESLSTGIKGEIYKGNQRLCFSLELPDKGNAPQVSCIPAGKYLVTAWESPSQGSVLKIHNVPQREHILIHVGNTVRDSRGCVLVGLQCVSNTPKGGESSFTLLESRKAMELLKKEIGGRRVEFYIHDIPVGEL